MILNTFNIATPHIFFTDTTEEYIPYDCTLMQFIEMDSYDFVQIHENNGTLKQLLYNMGESLGRIKEHTRCYPGSLDCCTKEFEPAAVFLTYTIKYLNECGNIPAVYSIRNAILQIMKDLYAQLREPISYSLIWGDFKPDNIRFDKNDSMVLVDFECLQYFDVEYELSQYMIPDFMLTNRNEFLNGYLKNSSVQIDQTRLDFYKAGRCISQIYHCSDFLNRGLDVREPLFDIIDSNITTLWKIAGI